MTVSILITKVCKPRPEPVHVPKRRARDGEWSAFDVKSVWQNVNLQKVSGSAEASLKDYYSER